MPFKNKEARRAYQRRYRLENKEQITAARKAWLKSPKGKESRQATLKKYYLAKGKAKALAWVKNNRSKRLIIWRRYTSKPSVVSRRLTLERGRYCRDKRHDKHMRRAWPVELRGAAEMLYKAKEKLKHEKQNHYE